MYKSQNLICNKMISYFKKTQNYLFATYVISCFKRSQKFVTVNRLLHCDRSSRKVRGVTSTPMTTTLRVTEVYPEITVADAHPERSQTQRGRTQQDGGVEDTAERNSGGAEEYSRQKQERGWRAQPSRQKQEQGWRAQPTDTQRASGGVRAIESEK